MFNWKHSFHNNLKVYPTRDVSLRDDAEGPPSVFFTSTTPLVFQGFIIMTGPKRSNRRMAALPPQTARTPQTARNVFQLYRTLTPSIPEMSASKT